MPSISFFLRGEFLGAGSIPPQPFPPRSKLFCCETCGDPWGRVVVEGSTAWRIENVPCPDHLPSSVANWGRIPGSLMNSPASRAFTPIGDIANCVEFLPPSLLSHEMLCIISEIERKDNDRNNE